MMGSSDRCGQEHGWAKNVSEDNWKEQCLCFGLMFLPGHFLHNSAVGVFRCLAI